MAQLPKRAVEVIDLQKSTLFLRAADEPLRIELEMAMDMMEPDSVDLSTDWKLIEKAVSKVSNWHQRRELDMEAITLEPKVIVKTAAKPSALPIVDKVPDLPESTVDDLSKLMQELRIMTATMNDIPTIVAKAVAEHSGQLEGRDPNGRRMAKLGLVCGVTARTMRSESVPT